MMKNLKSYCLEKIPYFKQYPEKALFLSLLFISFLLRVIYLTRPTAIWWDSSVYIGMGKWLFSGQQVGYFEPFRPLLWPFVQGGIWKLGLNNMLWGNVLELISSLGVLVLIYAIGEKIKRFSGLIAAGLISFTPFYFGFTNVSLTDIPSVCFILLSFFFLQRQKPARAGFSASIAFMLRFPHALFFIAAILFFGVEFALERDWRKSLKKTLLFCCGFSILTLPFLISNYILYHDILLPLKTGVTLVAIDALLQFDYLYYIRNLLAANPLLVFAPLASVPFFKKSWRESLRENKDLFCIFLIALLYLGYFTHTAHKEVRYAIGFLPFIALLSGLGIQHLRLTKKLLSAIIGVGFCVLAIVNINQIVHERPLQSERAAFYDYFKNRAGATIITSSPMIISIADVKMIGVSDVWENALRDYTAHKAELDYIALDTCGLATINGDMKPQETLMARLESEAKLDFERTVGSCRLMIYKMER